ncbi:hypothetical protein HHI36_004598 [Cryptolaemus montrouzieri]|uniref:Endonuclease/exonuclease/phosphatase domain-containing protein n=1 Tax=Cryptolaemus montrouzieri TaxID=559131 RepID=A0ABD2NRP6_9CUCU
MILRNGFQTHNEIDRDFPTRIDKRTDRKSIIDHVISDMSIDPLTLIDHSLSDHRLITFTIKLPSHSNPKKQLYETKQVNYGKLQNELQSKLKCMKQEEMNFDKLTEIITEETLKCTTVRTRNHTTNNSEGWFMGTERTHQGKR